MDYNVRTRISFISLLSFISLRLSPVRQSSAISSFSIPLTCAPAHLSMNPLGTRKHLLLVPTPCTGSARPRPVPPPHRQIRRRGASPPACSTWRAASLPAGGLCRATPAAPPSYPPGATPTRLPRRSLRAGTGRFTRKIEAWSIRSLAVVVELQLVVQRATGRRYALGARAGAVVSPDDDTTRFSS